MLDKQSWVEEAARFGFHITEQEGVFRCTTDCQHCGKVFTQEISLEDQGDRVKVKLPVYCRKCEVKK